MMHQVSTSMFPENATKFKILLNHLKQNLNSTVQVSIFTVQDVPNLDMKILFICGVVAFFLNRILVALFFIRLKWVLSKLQTPNSVCIATDVNDITFI